MSLELLNYHLRMLADPVRTSAWKETVSRVVRPGDVVVDIGTGVGLLALFACQAGARVVYAIEESDIIEAARDVVRQSEFRDRIILVKGASSSFQPPEPADVVMGDLLGAFGVTGGIAGAFADARERLLKPGGKLVPLSIEMFGGPVELPEWYEREINAWRDALQGFDFQRCRERTVNQMHKLHVPGDAILSAPESFGRLELGHADRPQWRGTISASVTRDGTMHAIAGWCRCSYWTNIAVGNSPVEDQRTVWRHAVFPLERPVAVSPGHVVEARISYDNPDRWTVLRWTVRVLSRGAVREQFRHSTFNGQLLSAERFHATRASYQPPPLTRDSAVRRVLGLCDGAHTLAEIQSTLRSEFPLQFESASASADFVRRVIAAAGG